MSIALLITGGLFVANGQQFERFNDPALTRGKTRTTTPSAQPSRTPTFSPLSRNSPNHHKLFDFQTAFKVGGIVVSVALFSCFIVFITWKICFSTQRRVRNRGNRNEPMTERTPALTRISTYSEHHGLKLVNRGECDKDENVTSSSNQIDSCSICLEVYRQETNVDMLECGHIFHPECIAIWIDRNPLCPMCRQDSKRPSVARREALSRNRRQGTRIPPSILTTPSEEPVNLVDCLYLTAVLTPDLSFGVRVASSRNGLVVTYIEPNQLGDQQGVCIGDYLIKQDDVPVPVGIPDRIFVSQLRALGRPVTLGFARPSAPASVPDILRPPDERVDENTEDF
jgi:hypothetical protein